jgi:RimJ/RimL family protein N-acetyltransferase
MPDRPPDEIVADPLVLKRFRRQHVPAVTRAINESLDHLKPWMAWAQGPVDESGEEKVFAEAEARFDEGSEFAYLIFDGEGHVAGSCGLNRRGPPETLEIGYWVHAAHTRRGIATAAAGALTMTAFGLDGIEQVEIHCDARNAASAGVPAKLGYRLVGVFDRPERGEGFQEMIWAIRRGSEEAPRR